MTSLSYYLDENVNYGPKVAEELRRRGIDAITTLEAGRADQEIPDQKQLEYATSQGRVMVTQDLRFRPHIPHGGLVVMQRRLSPGDYIDYLQDLAERFGPGDLADQTYYCDL